MRTDKAVVTLCRACKACERLSSLYEGVPGDPAGGESSMPESGGSENQRDCNASSVPDSEHGIANGFDGNGHGEPVALSDGSYGQLHVTPDGIIVCTIHDAAVRCDDRATLSKSIHNRPARGSSERPPFTGVDQEAGSARSRHCNVRPTGSESESIQKEASDVGNGG